VVDLGFLVSNVNLWICFYFDDINWF
jgi:hypothetical protein